MEILKLFTITLYSSIHCAKFLQPFHEHMEVVSIAKALNEVTEKLFLRNNIKLEVVLKIMEVSEEVSENYVQFIKDFSAQNPVTNFQIDAKAQVLSSISVSAVFFTSSCNGYFSINKGFILLNQYPTKLKFLIFIKNCRFKFFKDSINLADEDMKLSVGIGNIEQFQFILIEDGRFL